MTKWEYYKKYINDLIEGDLLESGCSEETANDYKKAIKFLIAENQDLNNNNYKLTEENLKYNLFFKKLKELMEVDKE